MFPFCSSAVEANVHLLFLCSSHLVFQHWVS